MTSSINMSLKGQVAVVTGAAGGLGNLACRTFAEAGADIVLVGRRTEALQEGVQQMQALGVRASSVAADVTDSKSVISMVAEVKAQYGRIDILFNNAGTTSPKPLLELTDDDWHQVMDTSATGSFYTARAVAPMMMAAGSGRILNMGSILSLRGMSHRIAYSAAKAAVANLTRALAFELGPHGITVNALAPTVIVTDLNRELVRTQPELYGDVLRRTAMGRLGKPEDIAGALLFLVSPAAGFVTGQILCVDGGYTAG
ncbi:MULTISPECIES: SDR family NAD(P)-dependent oxidoreductase [Polaromonas]|uniref:SDR family NAD(P)-dependent oxidoreductase n=1 Tax=Polaromonas aquatica TaxID=332657 RepID=A0ABW1U2H3_9BURK